MGTIISILNFKGGVGKTTTSINLGAALAMSGSKVLIIDVDGQRNATSILRYGKTDKDAQEENSQTIFEFLTGETSELFCYDTAIDNLTLVPSSEDMRNIEIKLNARKNREHILGKFARQMREYFDYILIDCPPGKGVIIDNAMTASDHIVIPITCEMLSLEGMTDLMREVQEVKEELNDNLNILGLLATMYDGRIKMHRQLYEALRDNFPGKVFDTRIRRNTSLGEFLGNAPSIFQYAPESNGAADYQSFANEFVQKLKET